LSHRLLLASWTLKFLLLLRRKANAIVDRPSNDGVSANSPIHDMDFNAQIPTVLKMECMQLASKDSPNPDAGATMVSATCETEDGRQISIFYLHRVCGRGPENLQHGSLHSSKSIS
jgi:hypothetical protein